MKRAMLAVSAQPSEAGEDGAEIVAASPDSGSFGPIRQRTDALDQDLPPNVRCGSNWEVPTCNGEVGFAFKNGHRQSGLSGPKTFTQADSRSAAITPSFVANQ
jgi:hypothetical protein